MALYAIDNDDLIHANVAESDKIYWCLDCFGPVKRRKGKWRFPHFYHTHPARGCRLYSKSEDHLVAQIELQRRFLKGAVQIERPFIQIGRVADACWEQEKIVFEIQCSLITEKEVELREHDYRSIGYDVVWLLDDKRFNQRICRPAEIILRKRCCYFLSIKRFQVYDQFEIFSDGKRVRKSRDFSINLTQALTAPDRDFSKKLFPKQIVELQCNRHFYNDRLSRALAFPLAMLRERTLELQLESQKRKSKKISLWFRKYIAAPYIRWLENTLKEY